jgi:LmbE family N-acetylglucosaminyl deacetylase
MWRSRFSHATKLKDVHQVGNTLLTPPRLPDDDTCNSLGDVRMRTLPLLFWFLLLNAAAAAISWAQQAPPPLSPDERYKADILLIIAHPDDETAVSSYLARAIFDQHKRVAVIYGTRGDAGGNSVGLEQAASLGAVREIEARRALASFGVMNVWFLGGPDTPGQDVLKSLETWRHGSALEQTVRLVRLTRPEVILTWLPCYVVGENHDDHQAAGVIATEAFDMSGDPTVFPSQVAAPRDRATIGNYGEGLRAWQAKKLYYFSDASHVDFLEGKGPKYQTTDASPSRKVSYYRLSADEWSFHQTQGEVAQVAKKAIETGDFKELSEPERFVLGKSLVGGSVTADIFEGIGQAPIPFAPQPAGRRDQASGVTLELGGPWAFYKDFWRSHGLDHLSRLLQPEAGIGGGQPFEFPLIIRNVTNEPREVKLVTELPEGWTERSRFSSYPVPARESYPVRMIMVSPRGHAKEWQQIVCRIEADGKVLGTVSLRVFLSNGGLPQ